MDARPRLALRFCWLIAIAVAGGARSAPTVSASLVATARLPARPAPGRQHTPLSDLLERAGAYVTDFEKRFSALVAEEHYLQEVKTGPRDVKGGPSFDARDLAGSLSTTGAAGDGSLVTTREKTTGKTRREMVSDVLLVQLPDRTWFGFRDVIEVDGNRVRDREGRLQELFLKAQSSTKQIVDESARYNIGGITRNSNVPTFPLIYLAPDMQGRFAFEKTAEEEVDGELTWVVSFVEVTQPTIVRDDRGRDMPSSGRFWIAPRTARVLRTELIIGDAKSDARGRAVVQYRLDQVLGVPVPAVMKEIYDLPPRPWDPYVECTATYSKFRRFQVTTDVKITIPK